MAGAKGRHWKATRANNVEYPDTGCKKAKSLGYTGECLDCPFPKCLEETRSSVATSKKTKRNEAIKLAYNAGMSFKELKMMAAFTFNQVKHILYNYETYRSGEFVDKVAERLGIRVPRQERARFEAACLLAAEVGLRVKRCWPDGTLVEAVFMRGELRAEKDVAQEYYLEPGRVHALINRVVAYCTGQDIGCPDGTDENNWPMSYQQFIRVYRQKSEWRFRHDLRKSASNPLTK